VDLTAYRIVQEALTNATKHAATGSAHVRLAYTESRLRITVSNGEPSGTAHLPLVAPGRGFGIMGMRERARTVGGEFHAGPRPGGGFEVETSLPLPPAAPEAPPRTTGDTGDTEDESDTGGGNGRSDTGGADASAGEDA
jgi:glucose-6-phosphate-specific signal transduction histidine kinase